MEDKADALLTLLRSGSLQQPPTVAAAFAAIVSSQVVVISALNAQIEQLQAVVAENFDRHPAAEIYLSQPGLGQVLAARVLGEFGDDPVRFADARARKNYSGQSPITRASGKKTIVLARFAKNNRLGDALHFQAMSSMKASPGARAYYDAMRAGTSDITPRCGSWPTSSSAACTAASRPQRSTTRTPPGITTHRPPNRSPLDTDQHGMSGMTHNTAAPACKGRHPRAARSDPHILGVRPYGEAGVSLVN